MVFIVNRSGTRKDHRSSAFVPGNVPRSSRISWPISVNGARSMQGEVAYSYCARNGCLRNIRNAATDGHSISGKLVTRAIHATDIPRRDRYIRSAARFTPTRRYCVYTCTIHRQNIDNWPLMAVLLPRFETRAVLRTFFARMHARLHGLFCVSCCYTRASLSTKLAGA